MEINNIRFIFSGNNDGYFNMAADEILMSSNLPVLRLYGWVPPALSLGIFQKTGGIDVEKCNLLGIDIVRRMTGGKAVLHDKELTYSFIAEENLFPKSIIESYKIITTPILKALRSIGVSAEMNATPINKTRSEICYNDPSLYELTAFGKKIVGSAQRRLNGKILQHGSILVEIDVGKYASLFLDASEKTPLKNRVTSIIDETGKNIDIIDFSNRIKESFAGEFFSTITSENFSKEELSKIENLAELKYKSNEWTFKY